MEKFVYFLIWIKFIPVTKNKEDGGWRLNIFNIQHLLLMLAILIANGFYIVMVLCQVLSQIEPPSLNEWCVITFKISCMTGVIGFPFLLGKAVCAQGAQACHPNLTIPLPTLTFLCSMVSLFNLGLVGIHFNELKENINLLLPLAAGVGVTTFSFISNTLICFAWIYDLLTTCPDGEQLELVNAEESDAVLNRFDRLKSGTEYIFLMMFSFCQLLIVFSLYNTLQGKLVTLCGRLNKQTKILNLSS